MVSTAFQLGQTSSSAPDVGKARVSAAGIVTLLNRKEQQPGFQPVGTAKFMRNLGS